MVGPLGRGGMATVHRVTDTRTGEDRALKLLAGHGAEVVSRFEAEFDILAALDHPNVLRVCERGTHHGQPWFSMELLDGQDLSTQVKVWTTLPPLERAQAAENVLVQVAQALAHVHDQGLVHRDVTPGNIRVCSDGRAVLMDFGVVHNPGSDLTVVGEMVGTVAWIAPEQISSDINGGRVDARADLYSLGAVLYLMLTGRRPFQSATVASLLEKHLNARPRPPREVVPTVPQHLDEVCMRLLEKEPSDRFGSARHLLSLLDQRLVALDAIDLRSWPPRLVGRTGEFATLRTALSGLKAGRGGAVLIQGTSGFGRTRLLDEVAAGCARLDLTVVRGRCTDEHPFDGWDEILRQLAPYTAELAEPLRVAFGDQGGPLEVYPVMAAFRDLLREQLPLVVLLDDLHRGRRGTHALTEFVVRGLRVLEDHPILFVVTARPFDADAVEGLESEGLDLTHIDLQPIGVPAVEELLLQLIPPDERTAALAKRLHREGEGNPHFICEMIRGLIDQGVIVRDAGGRYALGLDITNVGRARLPIPSSIREALRERVGELSEGGLQVASALAVARQELTFDVLLEALSQHDAVLMPLLDELLDGDVVRTRSVGLDEVYELAQGRLADVLLEGLGAEQKRNLHRQIGAALERMHRHRLAPVVEAIANHFEAGEVPAKAYPYLVRAGVRLQERSFVPEALSLFDRALDLEASAREYRTLDEADRQLATLRVHRGEALFHLGQWQAADAEFVQADQLALELGDDRLLVRTLSARAQFARNQTRLDQAEALYTEALALANRLQEPRLRMHPLNGLASVRWTNGNLDGARQLYLEALAVGGAVQDDLAQGNGYNGLGLVSFCQGNAADARKYLEQACTAFNRLGKLTRLVVSRINLIELSHCTGNLRKALQQADRTIAQAREIRYTYGIALGLQYRAMILVDLNRLQEARTNADEALRLLRELDQSEDLLALYVHMLRIAWREGDEDQISGLLDELMALRASYDTEGYGPILDGWVALLAARRGDRDAALTALERADQPSERPWPHQQCRLDLIVTRVLAALGDTDAAVKRAGVALKRADRCGYRFYSLKAHTLMARYSTDETQVALHTRVARALTRSLASNLGREDADRFVDAQP